MESSGPLSDVRPRLTTARAKLDARDLAGALAIYEEVLAVAGQRADVLLTISGDLGTTGHVPQIVELIAPRYDAERHGPAIGLNLLQAYIALRNVEAAQHVLDILFGLNRPELEERLYGFSNAIAELALAGHSGGAGLAADHPAAGAGLAPVDAGVAALGFKVALANISKPVWFYGLEPLTDRILPAKDGRQRRVAFAQLALTESDNPIEAMKKPEDELGLLSRAIPLWLAETFYFSPRYSSLAALGFMDEADGSRHPMIFWSEWNTENLQRLIESSKESLDYIFTGSLQHRAGDYELTLRVWEAKKFRERKQFSVRWTPATADAELARFHAQVRQFMEWAPYPPGEGLTYAPPAAPRAWLDALGASIGLFFVEKKIFPSAALSPLDPHFSSLAPLAASEPAAALAWLTLAARARALGLAPGDLPAPALCADPLVAEARNIAAC